MRSKISRAIIAAGFGPLCFDGEQGAPGGDTPPAGGNGGGGTPPAGNTPPAAGDDRSNWIPRGRFDEVNGELQKLRSAEEERQRAEAERKGEFEKLAATEKAKREEAESRATSIARRAAFIAASAGKVADPEAAYKLAAADGLLNDLAVDELGNAKDAAVPGKIVEELLKKYAFLKMTDNKNSRSFGDDRSGAGNGGTPNFDPSKAGARDLLRAGYEALGTPGRRG